MATHSVNVLVKARDEASKKFGRIGQAAGGMGGMLKKAAVAAGVYFSARAIKGFVTESLELYGRQEKAVKSLTDALDLLGRGGRQNMADMQQFASSIQKITVHGDEAVLEIMTLGASIGKLSGEKLQQATKAAIGLSKAFGMDLTASMKLVARAAVGDTASLTRYGIKLEQGLTSQEKFNRVLQIGVKNFKLAEGETSTFTGAIEQAKNAVGDLKEILGKAFAPVIKDFADWMKTANMDTLKSALNITKWVVSVSTAIIITPKIIAAITGIVKAFHALAAGQAIVQGLAGPAGWATLAAGAAFAAAAVLEINDQFDKFIDKLDDDFSAAEKGIGGVNAVLDRVKSNLGGLNTVGANVARTIKSITTPAPWKKIKDEIGTLIQKVKDYGKTEEELFLRRMKQAGYTEQSLQMVLKYYRQLKQLESQKTQLELQKTNAESVLDAIKSLKREIATFGKDRFEIMLFDLKQLGATNEQLTTAKNLMNELRQLKKGEKPEEHEYEVKQSLAVKEARLLTAAPGARYNKTELYAKNTQKYAGQTVKVLEKIDKGIAKLQKPTLGGTQLQVANFG